MAPFVVLIYLFAWETTFTRKTVPPPVSSGDSFIDSDPFGKDSKDSELTETETIDKSSSIMPETGADERMYTFREQLKVYRGRVTNRSFVKSFLQPFPLMIFPSNIFSTVINGAFLTWIVMSGYITFQVLAYPPYNLQPHDLAYISLPGSAVGLICAMLVGFLSDWLIKFMAHRNGGIYEPEYRLLMMIPAVIFSTLGFLLLGPAYARHAPVPQVVGYGLVFHIAGPFASAASITYIFDTQNKNTTEAFVATSLFKGIFIFFATQYVPGWFAQVGPVRCYRTLAILNVCFSSLTIPMYVYGKRLRGAVS
jgi:hypothetical protein